MNSKKICTFFMIIVISLYNLTISDNCASADTKTQPDYFYAMVDYLNAKQDKKNNWGMNTIYDTTNIINSLETVYEITNSEAVKEILLEDYMIWGKTASKNFDDVSKRLTIKCMQNEWDIEWLKEAQNPDGGFGLAEEYASDILDTKLALKALIDTGEKEAMINAAGYIASMQNEDGGFGYQQGLSSSPSLTADIANILVDTLEKSPMIDTYLEVTFKALDSYLDANCPALDKLSEDNTEEVYQYFNTALYKTKRTGSIDISPYYALQSEDGGVFDDPMSTALYLELLVRNDGENKDTNNSEPNNNAEPNTNEKTETGISAIEITNDSGAAVSTFIEGENVNISAVYNCEKNEAYLNMRIIEPDGTIIALKGENVVLNTTGAPEGEYKVQADLIQKSDDKVIVSKEVTFRIQLSSSSESTTTTATTSADTGTTVTTSADNSTKPEFKLGDVDGNGVIDGIDATAVLTYYAHTSTNSDGGFDERQKLAADVSGDGVIDGIDATMLLTFYAYTSTGHSVTLEEFISANVT